MAQTSFRCKLVTPTAALVDAPVAYASVPLHDGPTSWSEFAGLTER